MKREFYFRSKDKETQIHAIEWKPEGEVKGVLQLCHGMVEYIDRYHDFAEFMSKQGYYVVGHDHLGHGQSVVSEDKLGYFAEKKGNDRVIGDIHQLRLKTEEKYSGIPYFMMGHSMGSFLVRQYAGVYGEGLSGVIIMGTGNQATVTLNAGMFVCKFISMLRGWEHRSKLVDSMAVGAYDKVFAKETDGSNWLSRNVDVVKKYKNDPRCGFRFTVNAYYNMFKGMKKMNDQEANGTTPKDLPVFFVAGDDDPVGNMGIGVRHVYEKYQKLGMKDVAIKLYPDNRHEILNEFDKEIVYQDLLNWLDSKR